MIHSNGPIFSSILTVKMKINIELFLVVKLTSASIEGLLLIAASAIPGGYFCDPNVFLHIKEFELYWGAVFF